MYQRKNYFRQNLIIFGFKIVLGNFYIYYAYLYLL